MYKYSRHYNLKWKGSCAHFVTDEMVGNYDSDQTPPYAMSCWATVRMILTFLVMHKLKELHSVDFFFFWWHDYIDAERSSSFWDSLHWHTGCCHTPVTLANTFIISYLVSCQKTVEALRAAAPFFSTIQQIRSPFENMWVSHLLFSQCDSKTVTSELLFKPVSSQ